MIEKMHIPCIIISSHGLRNCKISFRRTYPYGFIARGVGLRHDEFDVFLLDALSVFLGSVVLVFLHSRQRSGRVLQTTISSSFMLSLTTTCLGAERINYIQKKTSYLSGLDAVDGGHLGVLRQILDLRLAEHDVRV